MAVFFEEEKNSFKDYIPGTRSAWVATCMCQWGPTTVRIAGLDHLRKYLVLEWRISFAIEMKKYWFWDENIYWFLVGEIYWFCDEEIYWFCDEEILKSKFREIFTLRGTFINGKMCRTLRAWFVRFAKMHLPQLEREWFVEFSENAFTSLITTASSLVAALAGLAPSNHFFAISYVFMISCNISYVFPQFKLCVSWSSSH